VGVQAVQIGVPGAGAGDTPAVQVEDLVTVDLAILAAARPPCEPPGGGSRLGQFRDAWHRCGKGMRTAPAGPR